MESWHKVELHRRQLIYQTGDFGRLSSESTEASPTPAQWEQFWADAEKAGVWSWRRDYSTPVLDGTSWSLELKHAGKRVSSGGCNGYPGSDDAVYHPGCAFDVFLKSLMTLTGKKWGGFEET